MKYTTELSMYVSPLLQALVPRRCCYLLAEGSKLVLVSFVPRLAQCGLALAVLAHVTVHVLLGWSIRVRSLANYGVASCRRTSSASVACVVLLQWPRFYVTMCTAVR